MGCTIINICYLWGGDCMKKDVTYDLLNHISVLTARLSGCTVPESRLFSKKDIQIQLQEMRKLIIDGELDILPEQKNDLSNYTVGEIKDICTKHKKVDEWRLEQSIIRTKVRRPDLYEKWLAENPPKPEKKKRRRKKTSTETGLDTETNKN